MSKYGESKQRFQEYFNILHYLKYENAYKFCKYKKLKALFPRR